MHARQEPLEFAIFREVQYVSMVAYCESSSHSYLRSIEATMFCRRKVSNVIYRRRATNGHASGYTKTHTELVFLKTRRQCAVSYCLVA